MVCRFVNVTDEYIENALPGSGELMIEEGYDCIDHKDEIKIARWLHVTFGGDITLRVEKQFENVKNADYTWRGHLWELKSVTEKTADARVRKALKQIYDNPGGIILECKNNKTRISAIKKAVDDRLCHRRKKVPVDIMIVKGMQLIEVLRYKE